VQSECAARKSDVFLALTLALAMACGGATQEAATPEKNVTKEPTPTSSDARWSDLRGGAKGPPSNAPALERDYDRFGFPTLSRYWTANEYAIASKALGTLAADAPELMPRRDGPGAALFQRFASREAYVATLKTEELAANALMLGPAIGVITQHYRLQVEVQKRKELGSEWVEVCALYVDTTPMSLELLQTIFAALPNDELARDLWVKLRMHTVLEGYFVLRAASMSERAPQDEFRQRFATSSQVVGSLLIPREKDIFGDAVRKFIYMGHVPEMKAVLQGFTAKEPHALVTEYAKAHKAESVKVWSR
jgi:hypothetical protein